MSPQDNAHSGNVSLAPLITKAHHLSRSGFLAKAAVSEMERQ